MKKLIVLASIVMLLVLNSNESITIPKESIRFRVIAATNSKKDQEIKKEISTNLRKEVTSLLETSNNLDDSRKIINSNLKLIDDNIKKTLETKNIEENYSVNYGFNYFPKKEYKGITYEEGEYESLVVKLGKGEGENFWCVLFPPLCFDDNSNDDNYKSLVKEIIDKYF